jgi:hypothetical protein
MTGGHQTTHVAMNGVFSSVTPWLLHTSKILSTVGILVNKRGAVSYHRGFFPMNEANHH